MDNIPYFNSYLSFSSPSNEFEFIFSRKRSGYIRKKYNFEIFTNNNCGFVVLDCGIIDSYLLKWWSDKRLNSF